MPNYSRLLLACLQAVARVEHDAISVRLGVPSERSQAQLDGFKSRALLAEAPIQRHLYATAWLQVEVANTAGTEVLAIRRTAMVTSSDLETSVQSHHDKHSLVIQPHSQDGTAVAAMLATQGMPLTLTAIAGFEMVLTLVQAQTLTSEASSVWLLTNEPRAALEGEGQAGLWGLARATRTETSTCLKCIGAPLSHAMRAPLVTEPEILVHWDAACVPRLRNVDPSFSGHVWLHFHARGAISNLFIQGQATLPPPGDTAHVLLHVHAVGLNFRDVMNVLGMYPGDPYPPGGED